MAQTALPSLSDPAISPDGREIAFVAGGDIWTVAATGGEAHLLVTHPATESRPLYSPDGTKMAFVSMRTGAGNIYVLTLASGELTRLTYSDRPDALDGWSHDGKWIYFTSAVNDVGGQGDIFRVSSGGGTPLEVSRERYLGEFESAPSPDGQTIALIAKGLSFAQWWRNGHAHIDETEVWLKPVAESGKYRMLLKADAKHSWPMWSADGKTLFYMSDVSGAENIWAVPVGAPESAKGVSHFKEGRVLWPSIGDGGSGTDDGDASAACGCGGGASVGRVRCPVGASREGVTGHAIKKTGKCRVVIIEAGLNVRFSFVRFDTKVLFQAETFA
jgi:Tol biopolymer transport system component